MKKHIKKVHCHTKKIFKAMDKHAHAFMLFLGGLFLIVMASSTQQLMGTHAAIDEISSTTNQIQNLSPEEVIGNIDGLSIQETFTHIVGYFQQIFATFYDSIIAKISEISLKIQSLETRTSTLEIKVNELLQTPEGTHGGGTVSTNDSNPLK